MFKPVCLQRVFPTVCIVEDSYTSIQAVFLQPDSPPYRMYISILED
jgi:hypothetical protein